MHCRCTGFPSSCHWQECTTGDESGVFSRIHKVPYRLRGRGDIKRRSHLHARRGRLESEGRRILGRFSERSTGRLENSIAFQSNLAHVSCKQRRNSSCVKHFKRPDEQRYGRNEKLFHERSIRKLIEAPPTRGWILRKGESETINLSTM